MKFSKLLRTSAVVAAAVFAVGTAQAQSPDQQMGVGLSTSPSIYVAYAITPGLHAGLNFGYSNRTTSFSQTEGTTTVETERTGSDFIIGPYVKFLFMGTPVFKPFGEVRLDYTSSTVEQPVSTGGATTVKTTQSRSSIIVAGGAEYFVSRNLGIYGKIEVFGFDLSADPDASKVTSKTTGFGIAAPSLGVEWFF